MVHVMKQKVKHKGMLIYFGQKIMVVGLLLFLRI